MTRDSKLGSTVVHDLWEGPNTDRKRAEGHQHLVQFHNPFPHKRKSQKRSKYSRMCMGKRLISKGSENFKHSRSLSLFITRWRTKDTGTRLSVQPWTIFELELTTQKIQVFFIFMFLNLLRLGGLSNTDCCWRFPNGRGSRCCRGSLQSRENTVIQTSPKTSNFELLFSWILDS